MWGDFRQSNGRAPFRSRGPSRALQAELFSSALCSADTVLLAFKQGPTRSTVGARARARPACDRNARAATHRRCPDGRFQRTRTKAARRTLSRGSRRWLGELSALQRGGTVSTGVLICSFNPGSWRLPLYPVNGSTQSDMAILPLLKLCLVCF